MSSNLSTDPSQPQLPEVVRKWGVPAIKAFFLLLVLSGVASGIRSCASTEVEVTVAVVSNPRVNWAVVCPTASSSEKRSCRLPPGGCSAPTTSDPVEGKVNQGKTLWYGPDKEGVVLYTGTDVYGGTTYQFCASGSAVDAYYKLIERPS